MPNAPAPHRPAGWKPPTPWAKAPVAVVRTTQGRPWRRMRERVLQRDTYLCQPCLAHGHVTQATEVDHITPQAEGGTDQDDNLQAICSECHKAKTQDESKRGVKRWGS